MFLCYVLGIHCRCSKSKGGPDSTCTTIIFCFYCFVPSFTPVCRDTVNTLLNRLYGVWQCDLFAWYLCFQNTCNRYKFVWISRMMIILYDDINVHLLVTCLLSLCHCFRNSCTCVQKWITPYSRFNSVVNVNELVRCHTCSFAWREGFDQCLVTVALPSLWIRICYKVHFYIHVFLLYSSASWHAASQAGYPYFCLPCLTLDSKDPWKPTLDYALLFVSKWQDVHLFTVFHKLLECFYAFQL